MKKVALALFFALFAYGAPSLAQDGTVLQKLKSRPELSQFTALVEASEVSKTLAQGAGVYTVFAPSNKAMQAINEVMMKRIRANKDSMHRFVGQHILAGSVLMESNLKGRQVPLGSMTGDTMMIDGRAQPVQISGAKLVTSDLLAKDGVVHVIDTAILAASLRESAAPAAA
ncbi:MAG: fasciclin domain-containing protein, partial [Alphaproteobacteria bacterium]|nr:fasciclin domain-containing protein [Alphaproteobacteria bacterium]